jgi:DNA-binding CsgD family transcriptional regulator
VLLPFLLSPVPALLDRHAPHRTAHASLIAEIRGLYAGARRVPRPPTPGPPAEPLSGSEIRVLRYLPTNLTAPEIARELSVSPNTVRTHIKSLYAKLGTHGRAEAVECARALGLLAPSVAPGDISQPRAAAYRRDLVELYETARAASAEGRHACDEAEPRWVTQEHGRQRTQARAGTAALRPGYALRQRARHAEQSHDDGSRGSSDGSRRTSMSSRPSASASASTP